MRLFVAIPIPEQTTVELAETVARMRKRPGAEQLRWSPPESWHITLQFLGNAGAQEFACLVRELRQVDSAPVRIVPEVIGAFSRIGILHVGVKATTNLGELEHRVTGATARCGFVREDRPYRPHITLARRRAHRGPDVISSAAQKDGAIKPFHDFTAREFALYESFLGGAVRYEVRERFLLAD